MKAIVFFSSSTAAILFSSVLFLAGCAGVSSVSSSAPPAAPAPPTGGGSSAHGTFVYVRNDNNGSNSGRSISGFRMNPDGTLSALQGSPFAISGNLAVSGNFLLVSTDESVTSYRIDPSSGALTRAQTAAAAGSSALTADAIAADSKNVYVGGQLASGTNVIYAFSIDANGSFAAISGSPFFFNSSCPCESAISIGVQNSTLFASGIGFKAGLLAFYNIQDGALANMQALITDSVENLAVHPGGRVAYAVNLAGSIEGFTIGANGMLGQGSTTSDDSSGGFEAVAIDPTGKFLAAIDTTSTDSRIAVFSINPLTGSLTELGAPLSTGEPGGKSIAFDPGGRFVLITHGNEPPSPNDVMVFSFDPASATVMKIRSAQTGKSPGSVVIATF